MWQCHSQTAFNFCFFVFSCESVLRLGLFVIIIDCTSCHVIMRFILYIYSIIKASSIRLTLAFGCYFLTASLSAGPTLINFDWNVLHAHIKRVRNACIVSVFFSFKFNSFDSFFWCHLFSFYCMFIMIIHKLALKSTA